MKDFLKLNVYPPLAYRLIKYLGKSLKMRIQGIENIKEIKKRGGRIIYVFWHGTQFYPAFFFSGYDITILSSKSVDGQMQSMILKNLGYNIIEGSSSKGAVGALKALIGTLNDGNDIALAVDGPRGPIHKVKEGLNLIAEKTGAYIVPLGVSYENYKQFNAWDEYRMPKPFSRGTFIIGRGFKAADFHHSDKLNVYVEKTLNFLNDESLRILKEER